MSHASVLVAIPPTGDVEQLVAHEMMPFDEDGEWFADGSRWDWWVIGGRFSGNLSKYNPRRDPRNWELCHLCKGTGTRRDAIALRQGFREGYCNGCHGHDKDYGCPKGYRLKWSSQWVPHDGNVRVVRDVRADRPDIVTAAFLRDRHWHEAGRLGWWGMDTYTEDELCLNAKETMRFRHEKTEALITTHKEPWEHWEARYADRFLADLPDDWRLVLVDYHV